MKNYYHLSLLLVLLPFLLQAQSNSPDTTWVSTPKVQLDYFGNFDSQVTFPDGSASYQKIMMTCVLGQYDCPPGTQYCHQWDYTVHLELLTPTDTLELGRFITPYANSGWSRFGPNWKQPYVFDVTDFYPLLQGQNTIRIRYSGYSGGFTAKVNFTFIEGTPPRPILGIKEVYQLSETYGDSSDPYNNHLPTFTDTPPAGTVSARMKVLVTGHGSDDNQCCEFDSHYYMVDVNGIQIAQVDMWRNDCGLNDLYPQGGTWVHNRSNWCPGSKVIPFYHSLPDVTDGNSYNLEVNFENYNGSGQLGSYDYNAIVFYYGSYNNTTDVAITDIITPTTAPQHFRANPTGQPKIEVTNYGETAVSTIDINYGVNGSTSNSHTWSGSLAPMERAVIELPAPESLVDLALQETPGLQHFTATVTAVNGNTDGNTSNDSRTSNFNVMPAYPNTFVVNTKTNNLGASGYFNQSPAAFSWTITDAQGNVVAQLTNPDVSTQYNDTITLEDKGFYKIKLTSATCFGLNWWVLNQAYAGTFEPGYFSITDLDGNKLELKNYTYSGTAHDDWGCAYTQYFTVDNNDASVEKVTPQTAIKVYPNPATNYINIEFPAAMQGEYNIQLMNLQGKVVYQVDGKQQHYRIPARQLSSGLYLISITHKTGQKQVKKVIIK